MSEAGPSHAYLLLHSERDGDRVFPLAPRRMVSIGRSADRTIRIADRRISGAHAEVFEREGSWYVHDLASRNGTTVNGRAVEKCRLELGDRIGIGGAAELFFWCEANGVQAGAGARPPPPVPEGEAAAADTVGIDRLALEREVVAVARLDAAERLARDRGSLLSMAAHDLKTPLSGLLGYLECLEARFTARGPGGDVADAAAAADDVRVAADAARRIVDLLTGLLDSQRAQAGKIELEPEPTDLAEFLVGLASVYRAWAGAAGRNVELRLADLALPVVRIDRRRVTQVLNNLMHNALRHTPRGGRVRIEAVRCGPGLVEIAVQDEGTGFDASDTERMLAMFQRGTASQPPVGDGHGLGLAIVESLVALHGGKLKIEGRTAKGGARFSFELPVGGPERLTPEA